MTLVNSHSQFSCKLFVVQPRGLSSVKYICSEMWMLILIPSPRKMFLFLKRLLWDWQIDKVGFDWIRIICFNHLLWQEKYKCIRITRKSLKNHFFYLLYNIQNMLSPTLESLHQVVYLTMFIMSQYHIFSNKFIIEVMSLNRQSKLQFVETNVT